MQQEPYLRITISLQARFLLARLNPSKTHARNASGLAQSGEIIVTEDAPFEEFYKHLCMLVVQTSQS